MRPQVAISDEFLKSFSKLPKTVQRRARKTIEKFRRDPTTASLNYEPIYDMVDSKVRTIRVTDAYRAVVIKPPKDDVYLLVWVDNHDEAMAWARKKRFEVNPRSGALQVFEVRDGGVVQPAPEVVPPPTLPAPTVGGPIPEGRLLSGLTDDELLTCGVPEALIAAVRALRTEDDLLDLMPYLPDEAADALCMLADGYTVLAALEELTRPVEPTKPVDTDDFTAALEHPDSQQRFFLVEDDEELAQMLAAPLAQWRVFLHATQRRIVKTNAKGSMAVRGGAGTGKTVVLLHRARHLLSEVFTAPEDRLLVTTFTRNLADDLKSNLELLCGGPPDRVDVVNLNAWATRFLQSQGLPKPRFVRQAERKDLWDAAILEIGADDRPASFFRDEWDKVVQAQDVTDRAGYFAASRRGRGTPLTRRQRARVWEVFEAYRASLEEMGKVEFADVVREARLFLEKNPGVTPYRAVLADEVQDFTTSQLRLLRALVPEGPSDLFLAGDAHQRIYGHRASMGSVGINIRGRRSRQLRLNYRTTDKIRRWAVALLKGVQVDDLDDGSDNLKGYRSARIGVLPVLAHRPTPAEEQAFIVDQVRSWLERYPAEEICIAARTGRQLEERYQPILAAAGIPSAIVQTDAQSAMPDGVRLATMHRLKGLEFPCMLLAGIERGKMPLELSETSFSDAAAREDHEHAERCLLFVAATRARDELVVTGSGPASTFLE